MQAIIVLVLSLIVASASAQAPGPAQVPPLADSLMGQAKLDYEAGRILFDDQDYVGALLKFQRAFEQSSDLRLLWNMAVCEKSMRHYVSVQHLLERYRREGGASMTAAQREEVAEVLRTVRTLISTVRLTVSEQGASVYVDDKLVGKTPLSAPLLVDLGARRIRVAKRGYIEHVVSQDFAGGSEVMFNLSLRPEVRDGRLMVFANDASTISIDGTPVGQGQWQGSLPAGEHTLTVSAVGMDSFRKELVLTAGQVRSLHISLNPQESGSGVPAALWVGIGVLAAGGLATGAYFMFRATPDKSPTVGTLSPGAIQLP